MKFDIDMPLPGLFSRVAQAETPKVKTRAGEIFARWEPAAVDIYRWIECHRRGFTAVAGAMAPITTDARGRKIPPRFTHEESLWKGTQWGFLDLDNDEIPDADAVPISNPDAIHVLDPEVDNLLFAVAESVSSRWRAPDGIIEPPRWHGIFVLETPLTSRGDYRAFLTGLQANLKTMTGSERNPAQPCFGNCRPDAYVETMENVLSREKVSELIAIGNRLCGNFQEPRGKAQRARVSGPAIPMARFRGERIRRGYDEIEPKGLRDFCERWQVPVFEGGTRHGDGGWIYYLPCPFVRGHSKSKSATDAFLRVYPDGEFTFRCFHESCAQRGCGRSAQAVQAWAVFREAITCPVRAALLSLNALPAPMNIAHDGEYRYYYQMPCPRDSAHVGKIVYRETDGAIYFMCPVSGCPPMAFKDYLSARFGEVSP